MRLSDRLLNIFVVLSTALAVGALFMRWTSRSEGTRPPKLEVVKEWRAFGDEGLSIGAPHAPVTVVVFSDVQCPFCKQFAQTVALLEQQQPGRIRMVFRHFPIQRIHPAALLMAKASVCASKQGQFAQFHDLVFAVQDSLGLIPVDSLALRAGVRDLTRFAECTASEATSALVRRDSTAAEALKIKGTPLVLVNDALIRWTPTKALLDSLIQRSAPKR